MNYRKWVVEKRQEWMARVKVARDRQNAEKITESLTLQDQLREFYWSLPEEELKKIWNNGNNELPDVEKQIVRIALRKYLNIT